nr:GNAT family N-acyltransferase [Micromonospora sp. DSM 115978]
MAVLLTAAAPVGTSGYTLLIADTPDQVAAAQRLRHAVFAAELGANLPTTPAPAAGSAPVGIDADPVGIDTDEFDPHCDHLIVRDDSTGAVVGTYRMLPPDRLNRVGRRYAEGEFDLAGLEPLRDNLVEIGRSCVDPAHRTGAVINLMWAGIARYLHLRGLRWLGGCASVPLADGGDAALAVWHEVARNNLCPPPMRVHPHRPWLAEPAATAAAARPPVDGRPAMPPLLRGYLRLGAWVCGEPAYDPDFDVADLYVLLNMDRMHPRYRRHFLGEDDPGDGRPGTLGLGAAA